EHGTARPATYAWPTAMPTRAAPGVATSASASQQTITRSDGDGRACVTGERPAGQDRRPAAQLADSTALTWNTMRSSSRIAVSDRPHTQPVSSPTWCGPMARPSAAQWPNRTVWGAHPGVVNANHGTQPVGAAA